MPSRDGTVMIFPLLSAKSGHPVKTLRHRRDDDDDDDDDENGDGDDDDVWPVATFIEDPESLLGLVLLLTSFLVTVHTDEKEEWREQGQEYPTGTRNKQEERRKERAS